jgi:hypothetical protein
VRSYVISAEPMSEQEWIEIYGIKEQATVVQ